MTDTQGGRRPSVRFVPGPATALIGPNALALVQDDPRSPLVKRFWQALETGLDFEELLDLLTAEGLRNLPALALVCLEPGRARAVVRGEVVIALHPTGRPPVLVDAAAVTTWVEHVEQDVELVQLHLADDLSEIGSFEVAAGLVPASRLELAVRSEGRAPAAPHFAAPVGGGARAVAISDLDVVAAPVSPFAAPVSPFDSPPTLVEPPRADAFSVASPHVAAPVLPATVDHEDRESPGDGHDRAADLDADPDGPTAGDDPEQSAPEPVDSEDAELAVAGPDGISAEEPGSDRSAPGSLQEELLQADEELDAEVGELDPPAAGASDAELLDDQVLEEQLLEDRPLEAEPIARSDLESAPPTELDMPRPGAGATVVWHGELDDGDPAAAGSTDGEHTRVDVAAPVPEAAGPGRSQVDDHTRAPVDEFDPLGDDREPDEPSGADGPADGPATASDDPEDAAEDSYDHLFGATQFRSVESAAVHLASDDEVDDPAPGPAAESVGLIAGIPSSTPPPTSAGAGPAETADPVQPSAAGPAGAPVEGDHDGMTISLAELRAARAAAGGPGAHAPAPGNDAAQESTAAVMVHAVRCPSGHPNPPHAAVCRVCLGPVDDREQETMPRPPLGVLRFSTGDEQPIIRPMLIGRAPKVDGMFRDELPALIVVPSTTKEVSATHVEIRLEGWQVLVVDRQSTNGTSIRLPGREPQRLHPGEPFPVAPGTVISLADEVDITFEVES